MQTFIQLSERNGVSFYYLTRFCRTAKTTSKLSNKRLNLIHISHNIIKHHFTEFSLPTAKSSILKSWEIFIGIPAYCWKWFYSPKSLFIWKCGAFNQQTMGIASVFYTVVSFGREIPEEALISNTVKILSKVIIWYYGIWCVYMYYGNRIMWTSNRFHFVISYNFLFIFHFLEFCVQKWQWQNTMSESSHLLMHEKQHGQPKPPTPHRIWSNSKNFRQIIKKVLHADEQGKWSHTVHHHDSEIHL